VLYGNVIKAWIRLATKKTVRSKEWVERQAWGPLLIWGTSPILTKFDKLRDCLRCRTAYGAVLPTVPYCLRCRTRSKYLSYSVMENGPIASFPNTVLFIVIYVLLFAKRTEWLQNFIGIYIKWVEDASQTFLCVGYTFVLHNILQTLLSFSFCKLDLQRAINCFHIFRQIRKNKSCFKHLLFVNCSGTFFIK